MNKFRVNEGTYSASCGLRALKDRPFLLFGNPRRLACTRFG
jgi:hypothetical protein